MRSLIVGYGSIGKKHAAILHSLNCAVSLVTSQIVSPYKSYPSINDAFSQNKFDYVVIANPTYLHYKSLLELIECNFSGIVLVEKPLFSEKLNLPDNNFKKILIGYNLRFHELLLQAKQILLEEKIIAFSAYVGQFLPTWRHNLNYEACYSAKKDEGGGALRDLSHELDYSLWFCGKCLDVSATGGKLSSLKITSDDIYSILMQNELSPIVNLQINYLDRNPKRQIIIHTNDKTIEIDLIRETLIINGKLESSVIDGIKNSYIAEHQAVLNHNFKNFCDYKAGINIVNLIAKIETANKEKIWIKN